MPQTPDPLLELLHSDRVTPPTRSVLLERLNTRFSRRFFSEAEFGRLRAVALRLVPHDPQSTDLVGAIDDRLARGTSKGWRYAELPQDAELYRRLLRALPEDFAALEGHAQDALLERLQTEQPRPFGELLAELVEIYYAHPRVQFALGCLAFADAQGWTP